MRINAAVQQIDESLPDCLDRLRHARIRRDREAECVFTAQLNRLLTERLRLTHPVDA